VSTDGVKDVVRSFYAEVINERCVNAIDELMAQPGED
jgi:hypothetical protein